MAYTMDMELVQSAKNGDANALELLFEKHYLTVYRFAYRWCGIRENAEDITQDVFVKLVKKLHTFNHKASFKTWLYRITINTAKDYHRKNARKQTNEMPFDDTRNPENTQNPEHEYTIKQIYRAINQLPIKQRESVLLVFAEGMSHKAAAKVLGCMESTVSWRIFQARKTLKTKFPHGSE